MGNAASSLDRYQHLHVNESHSFSDLGTLMLSTPHCNQCAERILDEQMARRHEVVLFSLSTTQNIGSLEVLSRVAKRFKEALQVVLVISVDSDWVRRVWGGITMAC